MDRRLIRWESEFTRMVFRLAVPIALQSLIMSLMHIVDNVMIGQLGEIELAGVTQANRVTFLFQLTMFGTVGGMSVFTAQYWGKRDIKGIRGLLGIGCLTALTIAGVFAVIAVGFPMPVMRILIEDEASAVAGAEYLRIIGFVYIVQCLSLTLSAVLKSTEQVKLPTFASCVAIVTNTLLNYMLIFGKLGMPRMGITGAAIATLIGTILELLIIVSVSYKKNYAIAARLSEIRLPDRDFAKRFYRVVLPVMANEGLWSLGTVMYSVAFGRMGASTVAAMSIFSNVEQLTSVLLRGGTHACAVVVGMAIGAGHEDDAQLRAGRLLLGNTALGLVMGVFAAAVSGLVVNMFNVAPETMAMARRIIYCYAGFVWLQAFDTVLIVGVLRPGGDVTYSMFLDTLPLWLVSVPIVFLTGPVLGLPIWQVYLLARFEELLKGIIGLGRYRSRKWIHNVVENEKGSA